MIRIPQVRVVDEEGAQLGVMPTPQALEMAQERGLDLVEVAPMASPPVVKFLDFGQYKYELTKREKEAKRKQRSVTFKEVRLSPKIGVGDFDTKVHRAIEFLEDGDRIKVTVRFRGRELTHPEIGRNLIARFADRVKEHGVPERTPLLEGKSMHITMASTHRPKGHDAPGRPAEGGRSGRRRSGVEADTGRGPRPGSRPGPTGPGGRTEDRTQERTGRRGGQAGRQARRIGDEDRSEDGRPGRGRRRAGRGRDEERQHTGTRAGRDRRVRLRCRRSRATRPPRSASA